MLYDEPTSALDPITEVEVGRVLHESEGDRTVVVVAHKLALVQDADLILVMVNGSLVEQGTHEKLLASRTSTYRRMWEQQLKGGDPRPRREPPKPAIYNGDYYDRWAVPGGAAWGQSGDCSSVEECLIAEEMDGPLAPVDPQLTGDGGAPHAWLW